MPSPIVLTVRSSSSSIIVTNSNPSVFETSGLTQSCDVEENALNALLAYCRRIKVDRGNTEMACLWLKKLIEFAVTKDHGEETLLD